jgi:2-polyprenyl-6-methoxyphenol hydroxylase-like FAD-dependent oxidoreductase
MQHPAFMQRGNWYRHETLITNVHNIAVVGDGIAGIAASILLQRAGHHVSRFEARPASAEFGAGLIIHPMGERVLKRLGAWEEARARGAPIMRIDAFKSNQNRISRIDAKTVDAPMLALGIQRASLYNAMRRVDPVPTSVRYAHAVVGLNATHGTLTTAQQDFGPFDLIIVADGAGSRLRGVFPHLVRRNTRYETSALVGLVDLGDSQDINALTQHFSKKRHLSLWPVGTLCDGAATRLAVAINAFPDDVIDANVGETWRAWAIAHCPELAPVLNPHNPTPPIHYTYRDVELRRYVHERVVFVGDAAHAMSPQFGLGASLALNDACVLSDLLSKFKSIDTTLAHFDHMQRPFHRRILRQSRLITPLFQSNSALLGYARNAAMRAFGERAFAHLHRLSNGD